jgi:predicted  nucleic acid-binding Zn-ribbon protein
LQDHREIIARLVTMRSMVNELDILKDRISALAGALQKLRQENRALRESLRSSQSQTRDLQSRIELASQRLENILHPRSEA